MAFHGTFDHSLDAKHRLTVPSKLRAAFSEGAFLVEGADRCLSLYPASTYSALVDAALAGHGARQWQRELVTPLMVEALQASADSTD